jgi:hypothetical protein
LLIGMIRLQHDFEMVYQQIYCRAIACAVLDTIVRVA